MEYMLNMDSDIIVVVVVTLAGIRLVQCESASSEERETGGDNATHGAAGH